VKVLTYSNLLKYLAISKLHYKQKYLPKQRILWWSFIMSDRFFNSGTKNYTVIIMLHVHYYYEQLIYIQCFDAVGWAAGRASGL